MRKERVNYPTWEISVYHHHIIIFNEEISRWKWIGYVLRMRVRQMIATHSLQAQEVITCDLCVKPTQQFCNNCQLSLCVDCVSKHVDKLKYQQHDIVHFKDKKIQFVFPECEFHSSQRCEVHCHQCDVPS
ncbi:uncharacterized protein LOC130048822 [Ostrea edulis]|uniref:uncharacterized protein LOC130048822 n=1 Tax=Ostrea edulis TaxID=37623 RepID=UPI0024AFAB32|nr:uncharacterized protein LOC130048822 [Ostrea edulis]